jgi:hypothetical protein
MGWCLIQYRDSFNVTLFLDIFSLRTVLYFCGCAPVSPSYEHIHSHEYNARSISLYLTRASISFLQGQVCCYSTNCVFGLYPSSGVSRTNKIEEIKNYRQNITIHTSTNKSHKDQLLTTEQLTWAHTHINPIKSKSTIRSILIHHRQNPTEIICCYSAYRPSPKPGDRPMSAATTYWTCVGPEMRFGLNWLKIETSSGVLCTR